MGTEARFRALPTSAVFHTPECPTMTSVHRGNGYALPEVLSLPEVRRRRLRPCETCKPSGFGLTVVRGED